MHAIYWVVGLLAVSLVVLGYWLYRAIVENGRLLLRIDELRQARANPSAEDLLARWRQTFRPLAANDQFDLDNIVPNVLHHDEYGVKNEPLDPGDVVIDVGANIGAFSLLCHMLGSRSIFAYEPGKRNFELLQRNVGSLPGVHVFGSAVWRSDGNERQSLNLSEAVGNSGGHTVMTTGRILGFASQQPLDPLPQSYPVTSVPLDVVLEGFNQVKLLKLDCEGSEFPILLTSRKLDRVRRIVAEVHQIGEALMDNLPEPSRVSGHKSYRLEDLVARLESCGFSVATRPGDRNMYWIDARRNQPPSGAGK